MRLGHRVFTVQGDEQNIKITYPIDLHLADKLFQLRQEIPEALDAAVAQTLNGKTVVVIGGSDGIGRALCLRLEKAGARAFDDCWFLNVRVISSR